MTNETLVQLNDYLTWIDKIQGLPAAALVCFSAIAVGYILRFIKRFPNDGIPVVVILWGAVAMLFIADPRASAMPMRIWGARNLFVGLVLGSFAWMIHKTVLAKFENYLTGGRGFDTDQYKRVDNNDSPPTEKITIEKNNEH